MDKNKIIFVAEQISNLNLIKEPLTNKGYNVIFCRTQDFKAQLIARAAHYDILILECNSQDKVWSYILREARLKYPDSAVILIIDPITDEVGDQILNLDAFDYIAKPIKIDRLLFTIKKAVYAQHLVLNQRKLIKSLEECNSKLELEKSMLERRIDESTNNLRELYKSLQETYMHTIRALAQAIEAKDHYTFSHSDNVSKVALAIAKELNLPEKEIEEIDEACQLHDLGKIGIHDSILNKKKPLTDKEWEEIKSHALKGAQILQPLTFLGRVIDLVKQHHEHYNGSGYPDGLQKDDILMGARIVSLADAYEAMVSKRPYREKPMTKEEAIDEVKSNSGTQFDPKVVEAFLKIIDNI